MAPNLDEAAVRHVAQLARLKITDAEAALYAVQLSRILEYVAQLAEVNTTDVPPLAHPQDLTNVLRDDVVQASWTPDQALYNAPRHERSCFQVPKVIDKESA